MKKKIFKGLLYSIVFSLIALTIGGIYIARLDKTEQARLLLSFILPDEADFFAPDQQDYPESDPLLGWIDARQKINLGSQRGDEWRMIIDPMEIGAPQSIFGGFVDNRTDSTGQNLIEYNFAKAEIIKVPGDFNTQKPELLFYRDKVWFYREFEAPLTPDTRQHLHFGAVNFTATLFLNGELLGRHEGGYVPFSFDVTDKLKAEKNQLLVWVDNRLTPETVPTDRTDWWPYGGLIRDVYLITTPQGYIRNAKIELHKGRYDLIDVSIETTDIVAGTPISLDIAELGVHYETVLETENIAFQIPVTPELWSPQNPKLYQVQLTAGQESVQDKIGFRHIETRGRGLYLNGQKIKLSGIAMHEEPIGRDGIAYREEDMRALLEEAKALGTNFVRAAHYPYNRYLARLADEMGLMLWAEIPVYWQIDWQNEQTYDIAQNQLSRMIARDWNRASIIIWSVANETPNSRARLKFLRRLIDAARQQDDSRLMSAALLGGTGPDFALITARLAARGLMNPNLDAQSRLIFEDLLAQLDYFAPDPTDGYTINITDPLGEYVDVIGYNQYYGWYYSVFLARELGLDESVIRPLMLAFMQDLRFATPYEKPLHISEFGAGAKYGLRDAAAPIWSEEYQAKVYRAQLAMLPKSPDVQGISPWILKDFRAMLRPLAGIQDYRNRKGLIDENGNRKLAFEILQDFYRNDWQLSDQ